MTPQAPRRLSDRLLALFLVLTCLRVWLGPFEVDRSAEAQLPNQGAKFQQLVTEVQRSNQLLGELKQSLESLKAHTFQVKITGATVETK